MMFPIGDSQTLIIGDLSLTLDWQDFDADEENAFGYQRSENPQQQSTTSKSLYGTSLVEGSFFPNELLFKWNLQLTATKMWLLKAIYDEQQYRCKKQVASCQVRLKDQRLIFMGRNPRDRAKVGDLITEPSAPPGYSFFWAQFNIMLELGTDFDKYLFNLTKDNLLFKINLTAKEMDLVPTSEDT